MHKSSTTPLEEKEQIVENLSESKGDDSSDLSTFRRSPTPETVKNNQKKGSLSAMRLAQNVAGKPLNIFP